MPSFQNLAYCRRSQGDDGSRVEWAYSLRVLFAEAAATHSTLVKIFSLARPGIFCTLLVDFWRDCFASPVPGEEGRGEGNQYCHASIKS